MPSALPVLPRQRIASVDAMRGLTFLVMLFVNCLSGASGVPYGIQHFAANVDGMSLADIVFPAFLFVVGTSIPFSLNHRVAEPGGLSKTLRQVFARAFGLIVIGFFMVNTEEGYNEAAMGMSIALWALCFYGAVLLVWGTYRFSRPEFNHLARGAGILAIIALALVYRSGPDGLGWMTPAWWGILGCIGWAYLASSLIYLCGRGRVLVLALAVGGCVLWFALSRAYGGSDVLAMHATHTSIVLSGAVCVLLFFGGHSHSHSKAGDVSRRLVAGIALTLILALSAFLLHHVYPISKIGATPPWALYCAALCVGLFALLYWLIEVRGVSRWTALVQPAAANPLITYLLPVVLATLMHYLHLRWWPGLTHGAGAIAFSMLFAAAVVALVSVLNTYNVKLKL
jgi:heparan-alpha-glucosaminide N-acetyltransferase